MKLINHLLDYTVPWVRPHVYLFTGNSTIKNNGAIVMGRGAAKQVRDTYPGTDTVFGIMLKQERLVGNEPHTLFAQHNEQYIGWFKVKEHWRDQASPELIKESVAELTAYALNLPTTYFHMNYPGIGNGRLNIEIVAPLLETLPDNVLLYATLIPQHLTPPQKEES